MPAEMVRVCRYAEDGSGEWLGYDEVIEGKDLCKRLWLTLLDDQGVEVEVYTVDSEYVNDELDVGYADGGNEYSHDFIPKNQIWLSQTDSERRRWYHLTHEMRERRRRRDGVSFDEAHHDANEAEAQARRDELGVPAPHLGDR